MSQKAIDGVIAVNEAIMTLLNRITELEQTLESTRFASKQTYEQLQRNDAAARERIAALEADARRLDWLESDMPTTLLRYHDRGVAYVSVGSGHAGTTLRAAIDAAMEGE